MLAETAINKAITSLRDVRSKFKLNRANDLQFFPEWFEDLPEISDSEKAVLDKLKNRYFYYIDDGAIAEGTINIILLSPLIELMGWCDAPYKIQGEKSVKVEIEEAEKDDGYLLEGRIDALVVQNQFWLVVIEAKRYGFDPILAVPQTLAYMMANPDREKPVFGMATSGNDYVFIKLNQQSRQYAVSRKFTLSNPQNNELYEVVRVLKQINRLALES